MCVVFAIVNCARDQLSNSGYGTRRILKVCTHAVAKDLW